MLLLIDNFDSFSHILADYFRRTGANLRIVRNDVHLNDLVADEYQGLIISPGPARPNQSGNLKEILAYYHDKIPVLGVCLGHQAIGEFFGADLVKGKMPVHGKVYSVFRVGSHGILDGLPDTFEVTRYHSLELKNLPGCLEVLLKTDKGEIMAIAHTALPIVGIQFHPEAYLTQYGREIIRNWVTGVAILTDGRKKFSLNDASI